MPNDKHLSIFQTFVCEVLPVLGIFFGALVLSLFANPLIARLMEWQIGKRFKEDTQSEVNAHDLPFAAIIGNLERVLYIYGVVTSQYAVISGWLVMKAFFLWIRSGGPSDSRLDIRHYFVYLYGSGLSLIAGLALGQIAKWFIAQWLMTLAASADFQP